MDPAALPAPYFTRQVAALGRMSAPDHPTAAEVAREFGWKDGKSVRALVNGTARLDGHLGRPGLLSETSEKYFVTQIVDLTTRGAVVTMDVARKLFAAIYQAEHGHPPAYEMESHYLSRLAKRHGVRIQAGPVTGVAEGRYKVQTRAGMNAAMQSLKHQFHAVFPHGLRPDYMFFVDETSVQRSSESTAGVRGLRVGEVHPRHAVTPEGEMTCAPFFDGAGELILDVFVLPGEPIVNPGATGPLSRLPNMMLMWTPSGRMQGDRDGIGSWHAAAKRFSEKIVGIHGPWSKENGFRMALFLDGAQVHLDEGAIGELDRAGVAVFKLPPNLTQVIQVPDNDHVFGKFKENLRKAVWSSSDEFKVLPPELYLAEVHKIIAGTLTISAVTHAMKECGFVHGPDGLVRVTDESISACLDMWAAQGKIYATDVLGPEEGVALRNKFVLDLQHVVAEGVSRGVLPPDTREWVNPAVVDATAKVTSLVPTRARRAQSGVQAALRKGQRRVHVSSSACAAGTRSGTVVLNDVAALAPPSPEAAPGTAAAAGPVHVQRAQTLDHLLASQPDKKRALEKALPGVNLEDVRAPIVKYLRGSRGIEWTTARVGAVLAQQTRDRSRATRHGA